MLTQWGSTGQLQQLADVACGRLNWANNHIRPEDSNKDEVLEERLGDLGIPLVLNLPLGHGHPQPGPAPWPHRRTGWPSGQPPPGSMICTLLLSRGLRGGITTVSISTVQAMPVSRQDQEPASSTPSSISTASGSAVVVTAHPQASRAALAVLQSEGHAVDALVAAQAVLAVVEPQSSGLGWGGSTPLERATAPLGGAGLP